MFKSDSINSRIVHDCIVTVAQNSWLINSCVTLDTHMQREVTCPRLDVPENALIVYSSNAITTEYNLGITATYSCLSGFSLERGDQERVCQPDAAGTSGEWSGVALECVGEC